MGLTRVELVTSRLSGVRSNQLSYRPRIKTPSHEALIIKKESERDENRLRDSLQF